MALRLILVQGSILLDWDHIQLRLSGDLSTPPDSGCVIISNDLVAMMSETIISIRKLPLSFSYGHFGSCLHFNSNAVI